MSHLRSFLRAAWRLILWIFCSDSGWVLFPWIGLTLIVYLTLFGCGGGESTTPVAAGPAPKVTEVTWTRTDDIDVCCNYTPMVYDAAGTLRIYSNSADGGTGDWFEWRSGKPVRVLTVTAKDDAYIRTSSVTRLPDGSFVALLYTGPCYGEGCVGGFSPSLATSPDGDAWTWRGPARPYGLNQSSSGALVNDGVICESWLDGTGVKLRRAWAPLPCVDWHGDPVDYWPASMPSDDPQFCTAARTPYGTHLICGNGFPASRWRHLWRCNGGTAWRVIEDDALPRNREGKGVHLAYEPRTGLLHAMSRGERWTTVARGFSC